MRPYHGCLDIRPSVGATTTGGGEVVLLIAAVTIVVRGRVDIDVAVVAVVIIPIVLVLVVGLSRGPLLEKRVSCPVTLLSCYVIVA